VIVRGEVRIRLEGGEARDRDRKRTKCAQKRRIWWREYGRAVGKQICSSWVLVGNEDADKSLPTDMLACLRFIGLDDIYHVPS
jgi:hypothetical protein